MWRAEHYFKVNRWVVRLAGAIQAVHQGVWLGLLDRKQIQRITEKHYFQQAQYQSSDHNLSGLAPWESRMIDRYFDRCQSVLVGATGGGREVVALLRRGLRVDGFECSSELAEVSRRSVQERGLSAEIVQSAPDEVPDQMGAYDGVVMGLGAYMHMVGSEARVRFLKQLRRHVRSGGPILVSFYARRRDAARFRATFAVARALQKLVQRRSYAEFGDTLAGRFDHYFSEEEIRRELEGAGFRLEHYEDQNFGHAVGTAA